MESLGQIFVEEGCSNVKLRMVAELSAARRADNASDIATRIPYFVLAVRTTVR